MQGMAAQMRVVFLFLHALGLEFLIARAYNFAIASASDWHDVNIKGVAYLTIYLYD